MKSTILRTGLTLVLSIPAVTPVHAQVSHDPDPARAWTVVRRAGINAPATGRDPGRSTAPSEPVSGSSVRAFATDLHPSPASPTMPDPILKAAADPGVRRRYATYGAVAGAVAGLVWGVASIDEDSPVRALGIALLPLPIFGGALVGAVGGYIVSYLVHPADPPARPVPRAPLPYRRSR